MIFSMSGSGVSDGIAVGVLHLLTSGELELPEYDLAPDEVAGEIERLEQAAVRGSAELARMEADLTEQQRGTAGELLQAHRLMLSDDMLIGETRRLIGSERINAEWALDRQAARLKREFGDIEDEYLALRVEDLDQVVQLLQRQLAQRPAQSLEERLPHQLDDTIVLAATLSPGELAALHRRKVAGLVTQHGSVWSHAAIIARALGIPMVVGVHRALQLLREGEPAILDSHYGIVLATRDERLHGHYAEKMAASRRSQRALERSLQAPDRTRDGQRFRLFCNAELGVEIDRCVQAGAAGVGLMRTEFILQRHHLADEQAQYEIYADAVRRLAGLPLTIRTLDAGGDKLPDNLRQLGGPNPALGLRGIRMSLAMREMFESQLRAMLRASALGPVRILLPMVSRLEEIEQTRELLAGCREQLRRRGERPDPEIELGAMIETPAAAMLSRQIAATVDFVSIGSNDLIQYLLAVDRQDELVSHLFTPAHRAVIETLARIVREVRAAGRPLQVCGELAADPAWGALLVGLGVREFSLPPGRMAAVKSVLVKLDAARCREIVDQFLAADPEQPVSEL
ncbi:MAG: phosphoenolpyruvate--protein phosphotransferase, partial [Wenzhouxiangellaceae bacterium]